MHIPKYQWLMPQPNTSCGFCDEVAVTSEFDKNFQLIADVIDNPELYPDGDYEYNPFNPITTEDLVFNFNWGTPLIQYDTYFTLYVANKVYVFKFVENTSNSPFYTTVVNGNVTIANIHIAFDMSGTLISAASIAGRMQYVLTQLVDATHGTTSTADGTFPFEITIADIPSGSYLDDTAFNLLTNISTVGAQIDTISLWNGYYDADSKKIKYVFVYDYYDGAMRITYNKTLDALKTFSLKYSYITESLFNYEITIFDDFTASSIFDTGVLALPYSTTEQLIEHYFTTVGNNGYTFRLFFTPTNATTAELAIDNISVRHLEYQTIQILEVIDCDGLESEIDYATTVYNENILVELLEPVPSVFRLKITDSDDNIFYSRWYSVKEVDECSGLIKVNWTNNCKFSEVDYKNLPFDNELLLTGVKIKQALELHDNVDSINASGAKISIYKNTQTSYELRLHPYLEDTQNTIERIFEHTYVSINNEEYNAIDVFQVTEIDLGVYTGRVDLLKKGTEIISSICCC